MERNHSRHAVRIVIGMSHHDRQAQTVHSVSVPVLTPVRDTRRHHEVLGVTSRR